MRIQPPRPPVSLQETDDLESAVEYALREEDDVRGYLFTGGCTEGIRLEAPLEFRGCVFDGWRFTGGSMKGVGFVDVVFRDCDLSTLDLTGCTTQRCSFIHCKAVGLLLAESKLRNFSAADCLMHYVNLSGCKCKGAAFTRCDMTGGMLQGCELDKAPFDHCQLMNCHLSGTLLAGIDFTSCQIEGWSLGGPELKDAIVTPTQAAELARLLGLIIRVDG